MVGAPFNRPFCVAYRFNNGIDRGGIGAEAGPHQSGPPTAEVHDLGLRPDDATARTKRRDTHELNDLFQRQRDAPPIKQDPVTADIPRPRVNQP